MSTEPQSVGIHPSEVNVIPSPENSGDVIELSTPKAQEELPTDDIAKQTGLAQAVPVQDIVERGNDVAISQPTSGKKGDAPQQLRTQNLELLSPADAPKSAETDNKSLRFGASDTDEQEQSAPQARNVPRKPLNAKFGNKIWSLPTPTPEVDPNSFEDPISEKFWNDVWVACAVHNVRWCLCLQICYFPLTRFRRKSTEEFFTQYRTITSQHGSSTKNSLPGMSGSISQYVHGFSLM